MTEERPSSIPPVQAVDLGATGSDSTQPPASVRHRDPGRVPAIPGLIAPRFVSRQPLEPSGRPPSVTGAETPGLMRPQLPYRKPQSSPDNEGPLANRAAESSDFSADAAVETAAPPPVAEQPLLQQRPVKPGQPQQVALEAQRPTLKSPTSTLTAMRIISIGIEDDPAAAEATYAGASAESGAAMRASQPALADLPVLDEEQLFPIVPPHRSPPPVQSLPELDESQLQPVARAQPNVAAMPELDEEHLQPVNREKLDQSRASDDTSLPAFDMPESPEVGTPTQKLPSFELTEPANQQEAAAAETTWSSAEEGSAPDIIAAPLPSFELPDTDDAEWLKNQQPEGAAVERLPAFELESPDATQDEVPRAVPSARLGAPNAPPRSSPGQREGRVSGSPASTGAARSNSAPSAPSIEIRTSAAPPPPKPARSTAPTIVLSDEDLSPDSVKPAPPMPPSRSGPATVKSPTDPSIPPNARVPTEVRTAEADMAQPAKRNPPRPPQRRSYPAIADGVDAPASATAKSRSTDSSDAATAKGEEKTSIRGRRPWWEELFNEDFSRALNRLSEAQIKREATFIEESLGVTPGAVVLDLGCGAGYHAVELAQRGYAVVGYDLSLHQLALAADVAQDKEQKLNLMQGDMREMAFDSVFDGIYCWDTTFGYFEEEKNIAVAARIFQALKPGGTFLVDVINRDFVTMQQPSSVWFEGDSAVCMDDMSVDFISSRLRVKRSVMLDDGRTKECHYSIRLYSLHELGKILHEVGFRIAEASGQPTTPGVFMGQNAPRIIILAQRP